MKNRFPLIVLLGILLLVGFAGPAQASPLADDPAPTPSPLINDALVIPADVRAAMLSAQGSTASDAPGYYETSAFMAGKVAVGVILPESSVGTESWTLAERQAVKAEIFDGLESWEGWWNSLGGATAGGLDFVVDYTGDALADAEEDNPIVTRDVSVEPITMSQSEEGIWMNQAMANIPGPFGTRPYTASDYFENAYAYANDLRTQNDADWAFVIFVADSSADGDGMFANDYFAYSYIHGPLLVMTYDNDGWGIANMDSVLAHETAHTFGAADQYQDSCAGATQQYGYLGIANIYCEVANPIAGEPTSRLMFDGEGQPDSTTHKQVGWRDSDGDLVFDPIDTSPVLQFSNYPEDPTINTNLTYVEGLNGLTNLRYRAYDQPLAATVCPTTDSSSGEYNFCYYNFYEDPTTDPNPAVTINTITSVQYRVDSAVTWSNAVASDGGFNADYEQYTFSTGVLTGGKHTVQAQATNSRGVVSPAIRDDVTVAAALSNDNVANPEQILALNYNHSVNTAAATVPLSAPLDPVPGCGSGTDLRSVWYRYVAPASGEMDEIYVDTVGSAYDTVLSVWKSGDVTISQDELKACNDDAADTDTGASELFFLPEAGATYYILVAQYNSAAGASAAEKPDVSAQEGELLLLHVYYAADVDVYIGSGVDPVGQYPVKPGGRVTPRYGTMNGPVRVVSTNGVPIFTSERALYGGSFNEVMGYPANQFTTEYWFPWYDDISMMTWILVGNPGD